MWQAFSTPHECGARMIAMHQVCVPAWAHSHVGEISARRNDPGMSIAHLLMHTGEMWMSSKRQASSGFLPVWG